MRPVKDPFRIICVLLAPINAALFGYHVARGDSIEPMLYGIGAVALTVSVLVILRRVDEL